MGMHESRVRIVSRRRRAAMIVAMIALTSSPLPAQTPPTPETMDASSTLFAELKWAPCLPNVQRRTSVPAAVSADQLCRIAGYALQQLVGLPLPLCSDRNQPLLPSVVTDLYVGRSPFRRRDMSLIGIHWKVGFMMTRTRNLYEIDIDELTGFLRLSANREVRRPPAAECESGFRREVAPDSAVSQDR